MSQRDQVLRALRQAGRAGVSNGYLNTICFRYGARIHELRAAGFEIRTVNGKHGLATFYLDAEPEPAAPLPAPPGGGAGGGEQAALFDAPHKPVSAVTGRRAA